MPRSLFVAAPSQLRRFESLFTPIVRARGIDYAARGFVRILSTQDDRITAEAEGTARYRIELRIAANVLTAACTCPHFEKGEACKHIWATLMVADRSRALSPGIRAIEVAAAENGANEDGFEDEPLPEDLDDALEEELEANEAFFADQRRAVSTPTGKDWRTIAAASATRRAHPEPARDLRYVIDTRRSKVEGALVIRVVERAGRRDAPAWRPARLGRPLTAHVAASDAAMLGMLDALSTVPTGYLYGYGSEPGQFMIRGVAREWLERLVTSGQAYLGDANGSALRWDPEPYALALRVASEGDALRVHAQLERGDECAAATEPELIVAAGFAFWPDRIAPVDDHGQFEWIAAERLGTPTMLPHEDIHDFVEAVVCSHASASGGPRVHLPPEYHVAEVAITGKPYVLFRSRRDAATAGGQLVEAGFDYGAVRVSLTTRTRAVLDRAERRLLLRDGPAEDQARDELEAAGVRPLRAWSRTEGPAQHRIAFGKLEQAARELVAKGWRVEVDGRPRRKTGQIAFAVSSGVDWLNVEVRARFGDVEAPFPELLAALRQKRRSVVLSDGSTGELTDDQMGRLRRWVSMARPTDEDLRFDLAQAPLVAALVETETETEPSFDAAFAALRRELRSFANVTPENAPRTFRGQLREYQRYALGWFAALRRVGFGGCLADDMGLGKTVQVLAMLDARRRGRPAPGPSLVVAPRSVLFNWAAEASRFVPRVRLLVYDGPDRRALADHFEDYDVILTTYGLVRSDLKILEAIAFDYVILDEAQAIKTSRTATAQAVRALRARHRLAMTGTPIENHLGELGSLLDFLNPGLLGASTALTALAQGAQRVGEAERDLLARAVRPFFLRRTKRQVAPELPDRIEQTLMCELEGEHRRDYDELHAHYRRSLTKRVGRDGVVQSTTYILEALLRLRQAACHPGLLAPTRTSEPSAKLDTLLQHLDAVHAQGQKALVFSQFTSLLAIVRDRLDARGMTYAYLDGATTDRAKPVAQFQTDPDCRVFLISLKAGGTGLNLTAAEYVFLLDPWWNPAVEAQAIDRAHRIGQTRTVFAYRMIAKGTVEEKVTLLQTQKRELADALFGEGGAAIKGLTRDDLELLLS